MKLVQEMMLELKKNGKTILISTHMMDKVEHMCDRIFMIHRGEMVLSGSMEEIKSRYGKDTILLEYQGKLNINVYCPFFARIAKERCMPDFDYWFNNVFLGQCFIGG
ncbi:MAG: hypothetical protein MUO43_09745, partial [Desulfobacterales bacterium]|nr:hypothetical protein [Desulfobacterales bacterium]